MLKRGRFKIKKVEFNFKVIYLILEKRGFFSRWNTVYVSFTEKEIIKFGLYLLPETYSNTLEGAEEKIQKYIWKNAFRIKRKKRLKKFNVMREWDVPPFRNKES